MPFVEFVKIYVQVSAFISVASCLRDRINRLSTIYCTDEMNFDQPAFGEQSKQVMMQKMTGRWGDKTWRAMSGRRQLGGAIKKIPVKL